MRRVSELQLVADFRKMADSFGSRLPLPAINPDAITSISLLVSALFLTRPATHWQALILAAVLLLDWLDGLISRKYHYRKNEAQRRRAWAFDVFIDRLSEGVIAVVYFFPLFYLFLINCILSFVSYRRGVQLVLPLRQGLLVYLLLRLIG